MKVTQKHKSQNQPSHFVLIHAEQNGVLVANRWNFSFGNGNEHTSGPINDWGVVMPKNWKLHTLTAGMRLTNTAATGIRLTVNGVDTNAIVTIPGSQTKFVQDFSNQTYQGSAGDTINFRTVVAGGGNDVVIAGLFEIFI